MIVDLHIFKKGDFINAVMLFEYQVNSSYVYFQIDKKLIANYLNIFLNLVYNMQKLQFGLKKSNSVYLFECILRS